MVYDCYPTFTMINSSHLFTNFLILLQSVNNWRGYLNWSKIESIWYTQMESACIDVTWVKYCIKWTLGIRKVTLIHSSLIGAMCQIMKKELIIITFCFLYPQISTKWHSSLLYYFLCKQYFCMYFEYLAFFICK